MSVYPRLLSTIEEFEPAVNTHHVIIEASVTIDHRGNLNFLKAIKFASWKLLLSTIEEFEHYTKVVRIHNGIVTIDHRGI